MQKFNEPGQELTIDKGESNFEMDYSQGSGEELSLDLSKDTRMNYNPDSRTADTMSDFIEDGNITGGTNIHIGGWDEEEEEEVDDISVVNVEDLIGKEPEEQKVKQEKESTGSKNEDDVDLKIPKVLKVSMSVLVLLLILVIGYKTVNGTKKSTTSKAGTYSEFVTEPTVNNRQGEGTVNIISRDNMEASQDRYRDYLIVDKRVELVDKDVQFVLAGVTTKEGVTVRMHIDLEEYNKVVNGQILEVEYNLIKVNSKVYTCNTKVIGVIAE